MRWCYKPFNLKERIRKYAAKAVEWSLAKGIPGAWHQFFNRAGNSESDYPNTTFTQPYRQSAWVMRAIKSVSEPIGSAELYFAVNDEEIELPELSAFWDSPVVGCDSWSDFVDAWVGWLKLKGEAFLVVDDSWALKVPGTIPLGKLILAKPEKMKEVVSGGVLTGWEFTDGADRRRTLFPEQVYQVKLWNPYNDWRGLGEMEAAQLAAETDYGTGQYESRLAANSGDQGLVVSKKTDGQFSKEQIDQITNALREKRRKLQAGEFKDLFLSADMTVDRPAVTGADVTFQASRVTKRHEIFAAFGVPPSLADVKGSYSYGKDSDQRALIVNTCIPTSRKLARVVTKLAQRMSGKPVEACVDFDDHPVMQEVRAERVATMVSLWGVGVPLKDASDYLTMDLPRVPGDDTGYLPFSVQPVDGQLPELDPAFDETATDPVTEMRRALLARKLGLQSKEVFTPHTCGSFADVEAKGADPRWRKAMLSRRATAKQFESKISRVLMQARSETLAKLAALPDDTARSLHTKQGVAADFVFDLAKFADNFFKGMRQVSAAAVGEAGNDVWRELGKDDPWQSPPAEVSEFVAQRENLLKNVPGDVFDSIRDEIQAGFDAGESKAKIAARVRAQFNEISVGRSKTIAQTETSAAYGYGNNRAQRDAGIQWRKWLSSGLDNVRESHQAADGQVVRIDEPFRVGDALLMYPGETDLAHPEETINCHCVAIAVKGENDERAFRRYNENHEPAGSENGGQFAPADGGSGGGGASANVESVEAELSKISGHEELAALDADGKEIIRIKGKDRSVAITGKQMATLKENGNATVTHNHPFVASLSSGDLHMACNANLAEIRAIDSEFVYSAKRPDGGWPKGIDVKSNWTRNFNKEVKAASGAINDGSLSRAEANKTITHSVTTKVCEKYGIKYKRTTRNRS